jgi:hypothetical protein
MSNPSDDCCMTTNPIDPMAMFRDFVGQWEKMANDYGGKMLQRPETAQAMHSVTALGLQAQNAAHDAMAKMLAAANMPSKAEVVAIGERLTAIEAALARIEAAIAAPGAAQQSATPKPSRTRTPKPSA